MATTSVTYAGTVANDTAVGTQAWSNPTNAQGTSDSTYADTQKGNSTALLWKETTIKLVQGGSVVGNNKSTTATVPSINVYPPTSGTFVTYGGLTDLWGLSGLTGTDINASNFGVVANFTHNSTLVSNYIKATNFGFSIPTASQVRGVKVEISQIQEDDDAGVASFVAGTRVSTPKGERAIETIKPGDVVHAFTGKLKIVPRKVIAIKGRLCDRGTLVIGTKRRTVETTHEHPFYTKRGWKRARALVPGDECLMFDGTYEKVAFVVAHPAPAQVFNFKVSGSPTYFANRFAVHNVAVVPNSIVLAIFAFRITVDYQPFYASTFRWRKTI